MTPAMLLSDLLLLDKSYNELGNLTPIMFAAKHGEVEYIESKIKLLSIEQVQEFLEKTTRPGLTALHFAALYGQVNSAKLLLSLGASQVAQSSLGHLPIHMSFNDKHSEDTINKLFDIFKDCDDALIRKTNSKETVAHFAASKGLISILEYLHSKKPDLLNVKDNQSMTPLLSAVLSNQIETVKYLHSNSDNQIATSSGQNALHIAAKFSTVEMLEFLLPLYDVDMIDNEKHTALDLAKLAGNKDNETAILKFMESNKVSKPEF